MGGPYEEKLPHVEARAVAHRAVTEGVNLRYVDMLRKATYALADSYEALLAAVPSTSLAPSPIRSGHPAHEHIASGVLGEREPHSTAVGDCVVAGGLDDLADTDELRPLHASDRDLNPVADVELHYPIVRADPTISYATVRCGICGQCIGCECARLYTKGLAR